MVAERVLPPLRSVDVRVVRGREKKRCGGPIAVRAREAWQRNERCLGTCRAWFFRTTAGETPRRPLLEIA